MQKMNLLDKKGIVEVFEFNRNANMISDQIITTIEQLHLANSVNWVKNSELTINSFNLCV